MPNPFLVLGCDESNFLGLIDTPDSYVGHGGKFLRVKATEDGIEFVAGGTGTTDELVKVSASDTTEGYLGNKLQAGTGIALAIVNTGGDEKLEISATGGGSGSDELVKVSAGDTTAGFLSGKLISDGSLSLSIVNAGGDEDLELSSVPLIDDNQVLGNRTWSSQKVSSELGGKSDIGHTHLRADITDFSHSLGEHSDVSLGVLSTGEVLQWNGTAWVNATVSGGSDELVKVSGTDTIADFLRNKLLAGNNVNLTVLNSGGDEKIEISSNQIDDTVLSTALTWSSDKINSELSVKTDKVSGATAGNFASLDTSGGIVDSGYSASSFSLSSHSHNLGDLGDVDTTGAISGQVLGFDGALWKPVNSGGDTKKVLVSGTDATEDFLAGKLVAGSNISLSILNAGGNELIEVSANQIDDSQASGTKTWSSQKISSELVGKSDIGHTHTRGDITDFSHSLGEHSDVSLLSIQDNQQLIFSSASGKWVNGSIVDDLGVAVDKTWSSDKISLELSSKADKVSGAIAGNFASLDSSGNLVDSSYSASSFAPSSHTHNISDINNLQIELDGKALTDLSNVADSIVLNKIKNVDGSGSGLDADLLDGLDSSAFASASHSHNLGDLNDVDTTGATSGQVLQFNGSLWVPAKISGGGGRTLIASVDISTPSASILLSGLNLVEGKDYEFYAEVKVLKSSSFIEVVVRGRVNGDAGNNYKSEWTYWNGSLSGVGSTISEIVWGHVINAGDYRKGEMFGKVRVIAGHFTYFGHNISDVSGNATAYNRIISSRYSVQVLSVSSLEFFLLYGDQFDIGTKIRLYEIT